MLKELCAVLLYSIGSLLFSVGTLLDVIGVPLQLLGNAMRRKGGRLAGQHVEDLGPRLPK